MRLIVVMAGGFGFLTVLAGGMAWEKPFEISLVNGIVSALVAGILLRWWMKLWISSLERVSREDEMSARLDQIENEATKQQSGSKLSESRKP
jgi:Co/Zn/Cd efflux system component